MRTAIVALCLLGALVACPLLQGTVLYHAAPGGVTVDLVFLLAVCCGLVRGSFAGLSVGAIGGLVLGTACGDLATPLATAYGVIGTLAGCVPWHGARSSFVTAGAAMFLTVMLLTIEFILLRDTEAPNFSAQPAALLALYHGLIAVPLAWLLSMLLTRRGALRQAVNP